MRLFRRMSALVMVLALLLSLSISVWAADYDAANIDDLWAAFGDTSGEDVNINLTADIDGTAEGGGYYGVSGQEGINYTIGSENGNSIGNIFVHNGESVTVDAAVEGSIHFDNTNATVNGDVTGELNAYESSVDVNGDVNGNLRAYEATVEVGGDVDGNLYADMSDVAVSGDVDGYLGAYAATVEVGGDVNSTVGADLDSTVDIAGDVNAQGDGAWAAIETHDNAVVNVGGDVNGRDGNPDDVDFSDPAGYSDGGPGISANGESTVNVDGSVTGGNSYGTFGYGGGGIEAMGEATVNVGGNVTGGNVIADPDTIVTEDNYTNSMGGTAIYTAGSATINVDGNVTGGNTNGSEGNGGNGIVVICDDYDAEPGSVAISGTIATGEGQHEGTGIVVHKQSETAEIPEISADSCDSIDGYGFTEEELEQLKADIESTYTKKADTFLDEVLWLVCNAEPGDEITVNAGGRRLITKAIIEAVIENEVTLIIKWNGGDDLTIDKTFSAEIEGSSITLNELAELLKK